MSSDCNGVSCFQQIFEKNLEFTFEVRLFSLFCEFLHLLVSILVAYLCQQSLVELYYQLTDLNQDSKDIQGIK